MKTSRVYTPLKSVNGQPIFKKVYLFISTNLVESIVTDNRVINKYIHKKD